MMFGHNDEDQHHINQDHNAPSSDGALDDNTAMPSAAPVLPNDDDAASDFIMTDTPHADSPAEPSAVTETAPKAPVSDDLLRIKQEAIQELAPMVDHLDQSPEEKFRTTMMMIQATDNDKLIPAAYKAAKGISDEKVRAQAYLDIVNEINYFTQADTDKAA
jgi:hypothetical protein